MEFLGGTFYLGALQRRRPTLGAYVAFAVSAVVIIWKIYPSRAIISISVVVGLIVSMVQRAVTGNKEVPEEKTTIYGIQRKAR